MIHLHNLRYGLACNSSSTHSMIFHTGLRQRDPDYGLEQFGWDNFTLVTEESKLAYVGQALFQQLVHGEKLSETAAQDVIEMMIGVRPDPSGYIDHQSAFIFPRDHGAHAGISSEFLAEFLDLVLNPKLAILGGNDNSEGHPDQAGSFSNPVPDYITIARKDGEVWTLFQPNNGTKVRISLDSPTKQVPVEHTHATTPELVDVKITDACPFNCSFCYQGSTAKGKTVPNGATVARQVARQLSSLKVFEVAIGGGEPTLDPHFVDYLRAFRHEDIVPNFTTKTLHWLKDKKLAEQILDLSGSFAYSVDDWRQVQELDRLCPSSNRYWYRDDATVQVVEGVTSQLGLERILTAAAHAHLRTTILGYKTTGRGSAYRPQPVDWLTAAIRVRDRGQHKRRLPLVSIDTVLAARDKDRILASGIPAWALTTTEGAFSMYVDLVERRLGPSSFCPEDQLLPFQDYDNLAEVIRDQFPFAEEH